MSLILHLLTSTSPVVLGLIFGAIGVIIYLYMANKSDDEEDNDNSSDNKFANVTKTRLITREEVSEHYTTDDLWVVIDNKVYDLSKFVPNHPGGEKSIAKHAGGDATKGFYGIQHPERTFFEIEDYLIGAVPENQRMKYLSTEEIKKHNKSDDLWLIVDERVFDVTRFVNQHPGGLDALLNNSNGRNATAAFFGKQHKPHVYPMINEYFVGYVFNEGVDEDFVNSNKKKIACEAKVKLWREQYTLSQVAEHKTETDAWIVIDGSVYDVTSYVGEHPGGDIILDHVGTDASVAFKDHPPYVRDLLKGYFIGLLATEEKKQQE